MAFIGLGLLFCVKLDGYLPEPLQAWKGSDLESEMMFHDWILVGLGGAFLILILVAYTGLLLLQRWAARLYVITVGCGVLVNPFTGPVVEHALTETMFYVSYIFSGWIMGLAFFSDALKPRRQGNPGNPAPAVSGTPDGTPLA